MYCIVGIFHERKILPMLNVVKLYVPIFHQIYFHQDGKCCCITNYSRHMFVKFSLT